MQRVCTLVWLFKDLLLREPSIHLVCAVHGSCLFRSDVTNNILHSFLMALMRAKCVFNLIVVNFIFTIICHIVFRLSIMYKVVIFIILLSVVPPQW
jgi:hypothetical protein